MAERLGHERQLSFFQIGGHDHDGENSTPVKLLPESVSLFHLNPALQEWIQRNAGGGDGGEGDGDVFPVPDLEIETPPIGAGASYTGSVPWVGISVVRFMRVIMSTDTECNITFYHTSTFAEEDREFRVISAGNKFLWEGAWVHYDETDSKLMHYKVENIGNNSASFKLQLKSGTMAANVYARFVESIQVDEHIMTGPLTLFGGNGVDVVADGNNITLNATAPQTIYISRYALSPIKPVAYTSSATISNATNLDIDNTNTAQFGSNLQWITADLGSVQTLGQVDVVFPYSDGRIINALKIEVSPDGAGWLELRSSRNMWSTSRGARCTIPTSYIARYIRVWVNGSSVSTTNTIQNIIPYIQTNKEG